LIERKTCWGEDRLTAFDGNGDIRLIPTSWTDYFPPDPFIETSNGRADFRFQDLLELASLMERIKEKAST